MNSVFVISLSRPNLPKGCTFLYWSLLMFLHECFIHFLPSLLPSLRGVMTWVCGKVEKELRLNPTEGFYLSPEGPKWTHTASLLFSTFYHSFSRQGIWRCPGKATHLYILFIFLLSLHSKISSHHPPRTWKNSEGHLESGQSYQGLPFHLSNSFSFY